MMIWLPLLLGASVVYWVSTKRLTCKSLSAVERAHVDYLLGADDMELRRWAGPLTRQQMGAALYAEAAKIEERGCPAEADAVRSRADRIGADPPLMASTGLFGAYLMSSPEATPFAAPSPPPLATPSAPPLALPVICYAATRTWVRPEPREWNDAWGRFGFTIPSGYPVIATLGAGPPGWAEVKLHHPEHGIVDGWVEIAHLADRPPPPQQQPAPQQPQQRPAAQQRPAPQQGTKVTSTYALPVSKKKIKKQSAPSLQRRWGSRG